MLPVLKLTNSETEQLRILLERLQRHCAKLDIEELNQWLAEGTKSLTDRLEAWSRATREEEWGLVRGLPVRETLPPTPRKRDEANRLMDIDDLVCSQILRLFGSLFQYDGKVDPSIIQNVFYVPGHEELQLGSGVQKLEWHVEDGLHAFRPDWVGLFCVRGDENTQTFLARSRDLPDNKTTQEMCHQTFSLRVDDSFLEEHRVKTVESCTLRSQANGFDVIFDPDFTIVRTDREKEQLEKFSKCFDAVSNAVTLEAGDMLVFNNRTVVHGRSQYSPRLPGFDRWLKRGLVISETIYRDHATNGRIPFRLV